MRYGAVVTPCVRAAVTAVATLLERLVSSKNTGLRILDPIITAVQARCLPL